MAESIVVTEDALTNFQQAFYSDMGDGKITLAKLTELAESVVGANVIPEARLQAIVKELQPRKENKPFDFPKMLRMLADEAAALISIQREDLMRALEAFEERDGFKRQGYITTKTFVEILRQYGNKIPETEIKDIAARVTSENGGKISLEDAADLILNE
eukprot:m.14247 g.14247  ORF g.14247 m.14247 type:complete len:159 (+) comp10059_c0_seq1:363-839(+)